MKTPRGHLPADDWAARPNHAVQFYRTEQFLADAVAQFVGEGLLARQPVLVIATPDHRERVTEALASLDFDVKRSRAEGHLTVLDARDMLAAFMDGKEPDADRFRRHFGTVIEKVRAGRGDVTVRAFGDMVDVLSRDGNQNAAIRLEELWNELAQSHAFSLLCAYGVGNLYKETLLPHFQAICHQHEHILQPEDCSPPDDDGRPVRKITLLSQRGPRA